MSALRLKKLLNMKDIDTVQLADFTAYEKIQKKSDVGGVRLDTILGQSPFGDEIMQIQLVSCREVLGKICGFDGASVVN